MLLIIEGGTPVKFLCSSAEWLETLGMHVFMCIQETMASKLLAVSGGTID